MHIRIHTHAYTNRENVQEQTSTTVSPSRHNSPYQSPPPQALRVTTRPTNPNPHSPHPQTSLLPRVLSPPDQSTDPLLSLSHSSTSPSFSLVPMHSRAHLSHTLSLTYVSPSLPALPKRRRAQPDDRNSRTYDRRDASAIGPRAANSRPSSANFPSRRRR
jgi:hypothetical protein